jgi:hypothetical protein
VVIELLTTKDIAIRIPADASVSMYVNATDTLPVPVKGLMDVESPFRIEYQGEVHVIYAVRPYTGDPIPDQGPPTEPKKRP